jgi:hypothetical protein
VPSQPQQLSLTGVTFSHSHAYVGSVLFTEAEEFEALACAPKACDFSLNNSAEDYGQIEATSPKDINLTLPSSLRSGAPLPVSLTLLDGFGQALSEWESTVATIASDAMLVGSLRAFYGEGAAVFPSLVLKGNQSATYTLEFTVTGPELFGTGDDSRTATANVSVQACELGERFDVVDMDCECAEGYGLVLSDHTCRTCAADEVVPFGGLSCVACPALSAPESLDECRCNAGYFGTIVGATGVCIQCPADTYRSDTDPPAQCLSCPETSHTFALGAVSDEECLCAAGSFNDASGVNGTFSCAAVPEGGWAPQADSRLFTLSGYWRPDATYFSFHQCSNAGMCLREEPPEGNATQRGYRCRPGHAGHLCAVCAEGWAYSGVYCSRCATGQRFSEWGPAKRGGLLFIGIFCLVGGTFLLFFLPLFPRVEDALSRLVQPMMQGMERALGNVAQAARPYSAGWSRPQSAARPTSSHMVRPTEEAPPQAQVRASHARRSSFGIAAGGGGAARRKSTSIVRRAALQQRRNSNSLPGYRRTASMQSLYDDTAVPVQRQSRVRVFIETMASLLKIIVSFWQVVSSFSSNLYVPWPSIYYALANSLNVVSLQVRACILCINATRVLTRHRPACVPSQFLKLPAVSCVQPEVSFLTVGSCTRALTRLCPRHNALRRPKRAFWGFTPASARSPAASVAARRPGIQRRHHHVHAVRLLLHVHLLPGRPHRCRTR